jgi:magnesium-transporting ATPase (P-type)
MGGVFGRIGKSFFINALFLLIALGLVFILVRGVDALSEDVLRRYETPNARLTIVSDTRSTMMIWCLVIFLTSWITSSLFLVSAERVRPDNRAQGASRLGLWVLLLIVTVAIVAFDVWFSLFRNSILVYLETDAFGPALVGGILLSLLAYYLATGLAVKRTMRPSVPFGEALPTFWS